VVLQRLLVELVPVVGFVTHQCNRSGRQREVAG
jgi:hypothetical protein